MFRRGLVALCAVPKESLTSAVKVTFKTADGIVEASGKPGMTLMEVGKGAGLDIEAACDGVCACSTCHCFIAEDWFDKLPPKSEDEEDMLDLAVDLRDTSRLACQITLTEELDGLEAELPEEVTSQL